MIATIARHQLESLRRQRVLAAAFVIVLAMTALAGAIGWSSHRTIVKVYDDAIRILAADRKAAPPNPFILKPTLSLLSNMAIYIPLIGALLAIVVGNLSFADDQVTGIGRLIFSRRVSRLQYFLGKIAADAAMMAAVLGASLLVSVAALRVGNGSVPTTGDLTRLTLFYALSWMYLMLFVLIGMIAVLLAKRQSLALLSALGAWLVITFVVPQFTSGLRPTTSLNPITDPVSTSQAFFRFTSHARPASISEQYKNASAHILATAAGDTTADTLLRTLPLAVACAVVALSAGFLVRRHDYSRSAVSE